MFSGQKYFSCKTKCAVFVSVDKLTDLQTASAATPKSEDDIKMGSLVTFFDIDNNPEKGIVRWIGNSGGKKIIGIEAVSCFRLVLTCLVIIKSSCML